MKKTETAKAGEKINEYGNCKTVSFKDSGGRASGVGNLLKFEAPEYSEEGILTFHDFIRNERELERLETLERKLTSCRRCISDEGKSYQSLFVEEKIQKQGIGRALWNYFWHRAGPSK